MLTLRTENGLAFERKPRYEKKEKEEKMGRV